MNEDIMKLITAYIQPERLTAVKQALYERDVYKLSVTNALGCGQQKGYTEHYRGKVINVKLLDKIKVEIAITKEFEQVAIDAITKGARSGNIGDGKIFVSSVEEVVRIRTGERGSDAL